VSLDHSSAQAIRDLNDLRGRATITVDQTAALLGVSRGTAYEMARTDALPVLRCGRMVLVKAPELLRLLGADPPTNGDAPAGDRGATEIRPGNGARGESI